MPVLRPTDAQGVVLSVLVRVPGFAVRRGDVGCLVMRGAEVAVYVERWLANRVEVESWLSSGEAWRAGRRTIAGLSSGRVLRDGQAPQGY